MILSILLSLLFRVSAAQSVAGLMPEPQSIEIIHNQQFHFTEKTRLVLPEHASEALKYIAQKVAADCKNIFGTKPEIEFTSCISNGIAVVNGGMKLPSAVEIPSHEQGYGLVVSPDGIRLNAQEESGLRYGLQTLRQLLDPSGTVPALRILDWPDQDIRPVYLGFRKEPEDTVEKLARLKINMIIIEPKWYGQGNWFYNPVGGNLKELAEFRRLCDLNGIELVPLIQGLGWAYGVVDLNPNCAEGVMVKNTPVKLPAKGFIEFPHRNLIRTQAAPILIRSSDGKTLYQEKVDYIIDEGITKRHFLPTNKPWKIARTGNSRIPAGSTVYASYNYMTRTTHQTPYCPSEPETYRIVDRTLEQTIKLLKPRYIHIGHDEVIYKNRCSRCKARKTDADTLMLGDLMHWYQKIKSIDPGIQIMMWDDLLRSKGGKSSRILRDLPEDIIICAWRYGTGGKSGRDMLNALDYFADEFNRRTFGTSAGYYLENAVLWRNAVRAKQDNPKVLGFFFSHWGDSEKLWDALPLNAALMWSRNGIPEQTVNQIITTANQLKQENIRLMLEISGQYSAAVAWANRSLESGIGVEANHIPADLRKKAAQIEAAQYKELRGRSGNPRFADQPAIQLRRIADLYEAMLFHGVMQANRQSGEKYATKMFSLLKNIPGKTTETEKAWRKFKKTGIMPDAAEIFGVQVSSLSAIRNEGRSLPVMTAKQLENEKGYALFDLGREYPLSAMEIDKAPGMLYRIFAVRNRQTAPLGDITLSGEEKKPQIVRWKMQKVRFVKIATSDPNAKVAGKFRFLAQKAAPFARVPFRNGNYKSEQFWKGIPQQEDFVREKGGFAHRRTTFRIAHDEEMIYLDLTAEIAPDARIHAKEKTDNSWPLWRDDSLAIFFRPSLDNYTYYQLGINMPGKSICYRSGDSGPNLTVKNRKIHVATDTSGIWRCRAAIPKSWFGGDAPAAGKQWGFNIGRLENSPAELSSWAILPAGTHGYFTQPAYFGKIQFE